MSFEAKNDTLVEFKDPVSTKDGWVRLYEVFDTKGDQKDLHDAGRLRFTFRGDRGAREVIVVREIDMREDRHAVVDFMPTHQQVFEDGEKAIAFMKDDSQAGKLAVSEYFGSSDEIYRFDEVENPIRITVGP